MQTMWEAAIKPWENAMTPFEAMQKPFEAMQRQMDILRQQVEGIQKAFAAMPKPYEAMTKPFEAMKAPYEAMMKPFEAMQKPIKDWVKDQEKATNAYFEALSEAPTTLTVMGQSLRLTSTLKERSDKMMEKTWELMRLPSAGDFERLYERLGEIDDRLDDMELRLDRAVKASEKVAEEVTE